MWKEVGTCSAALADPSIAQGPAGLSSGAESRKNLHNTDHGASEEYPQYALVSHGGMLGSQQSEWHLVDNCRWIFIHF